MSYEPLSSDFYSYGSLLTEREREALAALRGWLEREVRPIVNDHWERAEFPMEVVKPLADLGVLSYAWDETAPFENSAVFRGFVALELARVDASVGTFVAVQNGLAIGSIATAGSAEQRREWIPRMASGEVIGAFGLTEPLSGSDSARGLRSHVVPHAGPQHEERAARHAVLVLGRGHSKLTAEDLDRHVPIRGVILQPAVALEVEEDDRDAAPTEQGDLAMAVAHPAVLGRQPFTLGIEIEQVLGADETLSRRPTRGLLVHGQRRSSLRPTLPQPRACSPRRPDAPLRSAKAARPRPRWR